MLGEPGDALIGLTHAAATFKPEWFGDDADGEGANFPGHFSDHWSSTCTGATTHSRCDEDEVRTLQRIVQVSPGFFSCLLPDGGVAAGAEASCQGLPQLKAMLRLGLDQGLGIGVQHPIGDPFKIAEDHSVHSIAAATSDPDHFDLGALTGLNSHCLERRAVPHLHLRG